jgi:hypothetical protein
MSFTAAIDISTFIWSRDDYDNNKHQYYSLLKIVPFVYEQIISLKLPVLFRQKLYEIIMNEFPYNLAREISYEFEYLTLSFLSNTTNWFIYSESIDKEITSVPNLVRPHFTIDSQTEIMNQICHLFVKGENPNHIFISYSYFYNHDNHLIISRQQEQKGIETLSYSSEEEINIFFNKHKIKFEHNPKHNEVHVDEDNSPLSCYNERNEDTQKAQRLLDEAFQFGKRYYNFDLENNVYVRFTQTINNIYHGQDLSDLGNNIPNEVKKKFSKNGRVF